MSSSPGCMGRNLRVHFNTLAARDNFYSKSVEIICSQKLPTELKSGPDTNEAVISNQSSCTIAGKSFKLTDLLVDDLGDKVGIEIS